MAEGLPGRVPARAGGDVSAGYDDWHEQRSGRIQGEPQPVNIWHGFAKKHLGDVRGLDVLEIGCGLGEFSKYLALAGAHVTAADFSAVAVDHTRQLLEPLGSRNTSVVADIQQLPFPDEAFDLVVSLETLEHVPDPHRGLRELVRVTKGGGRLIITTPNYLSLTGVARLVYIVAGRGWTETGQPLTTPVTTIGRIRQLRKLGCRVTAVEGEGQFVPIPRYRTVRLTWLERPNRVMRWFATHGCTVAIKQ